MVNDKGPCTLMIVLLILLSDCYLVVFVDMHR